jgi:hypothetical protein
MRTNSDGDWKKIYGHIVIEPSGKPWSSEIRGHITIEIRRTGKRVLYRGRCELLDTLDESVAETVKLTAKELRDIGYFDRLSKYIKRKYKYQPIFVSNPF